MSDITAVKNMADARETGLKVVMGSLDESRKSARIFSRVIYCLIVLAIVSLEVVTLVTEHRKEEATRQTTAPPQAQQIAPRSRECTSENPCALTVQSNGSTETVQGKPDRGVCFDPSYWANLPLLGYHITYGGVEKKYECTREDVLAGKCSQTLFDAFRFVPEAGVSLPKYWFAAKGTNC